MVTDSFVPPPQGPAGPPPGMDAETWLRYGSGPTRWSPANPGDRASGQLYRAPELFQSSDYQTSEPKWVAPGIPELALRIWLADRPLSNGFTPRHQIDVHSARLRKAISEALTAAGAATLEVGGWLEVVFVAKERNTRIFTARYALPRVRPSGPLPAAGSWSGAVEQTPGAWNMPGDRPPEGLLVPAQPPLEPLADDEAPF